MSAINGDLLRRTLKVRAALLWQEIDGLSRAWISPALDRVASVRHPKLFPKTINDPVWGSIDIYPWEALLLDSPLIQRLRGIKQLAMAHHVYPGATHTRHSHSLGVVQAAEEMMRAVERNARHRRAFGMDRDEQIPEITDSDRYVIRLAGLLHDIGHGPYSHATEPLARSRHSAAFDAVDEVLRETFPETTTIQTSEAIAVLLILSDAMREFLADRRTLLPVTHPDPAVSIVARLLGSSAEVSAGYLSNIISGPLDADKLDYMARDSHHSGLPLGLDLDRLISKLEVIVVTEQNAPTDELGDEVRRSPRRRLYLLGISLSGLAAYEQMIIARVFLYDRLYYHHKIRAAEAMLRRLYMSSVGADQQAGTLTNLMTETDESLIAALRVINENGQLPSRTLKTSFESREIYRRSLAFAERFVGGVSGLAPVEQDETRTMIWNSALASLSSEAEAEATATRIYELARELLRHTAGSQEIRPEHVIIDVPPDAVVPRSSRILARAEGGELQTPNLYFNPERWSGAYRKQKHLGYVYAHESVAEVVA
ncbi:MAG TPA: HD domain-containing protein, partial [Thermoanaerobaculia bacterium]|nr:HD domain-containing protein [Thermoanaerobaculia bacterium]